MIDDDFDFEIAHSFAVVCANEPVEGGRRVGSLDRLDGWLVGGLQVFRAYLLHLWFYVRRFCF